MRCGVLTSSSAVADALFTLDWQTIYSYQSGGALVQVWHFATVPFVFGLLTLNNVNKS